MSESISITHTINDDDGMNKRDYSKTVKLILIKNGREIARLKNMPNGFLEQCKKIVGMPNER